MHYQWFDASDDARTQQVPFNATSRSPDGRLWFASWILQSIDPDHLYFNNVPPPVHIERMIAGRRSYETGSDAKAVVRIPPLVHDLEIDYTALSLIAPSKVLFRYKLDGLDRNWHDATNRRAAFYANLPPGRYRFHVIACNNDGMWNEAGALLDFTVAPTCYQTAWLRVLSAALVLFLLWALYQLRMKQMERQFHVAFEARVDERTRIARELHDTLL